MESQEIGLLFSYSVLGSIFTRDGDIQRKTQMVENRGALIVPLTALTLFPFYIGPCTDESTPRQTCGSGSGCRLLAKGPPAFHACICTYDALEVSKLRGTYSCDRDRFRRKRKGIHKTGQNTSTGKDVWEDEQELKAMAARVRNPACRNFFGDDYMFYDAVEIRPPKADEPALDTATFTKTDPVTDVAGPSSSPSPTTGVQVRQ